MTEIRTPFEEPIKAANLCVRLAQDEAEITASQKLRYRVFYEEMSAIPSEDVRAQKRDFDKFDDICDHLLVLDTDKTGEDAVVGTYRLLRRTALPEGQRFYTQDEYDVSKIVALKEDVLELGRSCVDENYRSRAAMQLLWRGIGEYVAAYKIAIMFGCASFHGDDPKEHALALSYLNHFHRTPEELCPVALKERYTSMDIIPKDQIDERAALKEVPALIKGYLRLGGTIGDGAVLDHDFNTTDVSIVVQTELLTDKYYHRYHPGE